MAGNLKRIDDKDLIYRIQHNNDQTAYAILLEKYKKSLYFTILKMVRNRDDAEDLVMKTFTKAFSNIESYDLNYAFSTWLFKIGTNTTIDFLRKKRIKTTSIDNEISDGEDGGSTFAQYIKDDKLDPEEEMVLSQRSELMKELLDLLDDKYKILIELRFYKELKYEEIADTLEIPIGTVKVRLSRAKTLLAGILTEYKHKF